MSKQRFGPNTLLRDEHYRQYLHVAESVSETWRDFFYDYATRRQRPSEDGRHDVSQSDAEAGTTRVRAPSLRLTSTAMPRLTWSCMTEWGFPSTSV